MFQPNLQWNGRLLRGLAGTGLLLGAWLIWPVSAMAGLAMIISAGFLLFEAMRGWCALRACGIKTKW